MNSADWNISGLSGELRHIQEDGEVFFLEETDSTNTQCLKWLREGRLEIASAPAPGSLRYGVVIAEHQLNGRGRMGRDWHGARGASLTFSLWYRFERRDLSGLSLAVGVAICQSIQARLGVEPHPVLSPWSLALKWPNDLVHVRTNDTGLGKVGGILVEAVHQQGVCSAVIGVGINVSGFTLDVDSLSTGFCSLADSGCRLSPARWLHILAPALLRGVIYFNSVGFCGFRDQFEALNALRGRTVRAVGRGGVSGVVEGVDVDGSLRVRDDSGLLRRINASEVSLGSAGKRREPL